MQNGKPTTKKCNSDEVLEFFPPLYKDGVML